MSRLLCRQHNEGVQSGDVFEIPIFEGLTPREMLERKAQSHRRYGWTVTMHGDSFTAYKVFTRAEQGNDPNAPLRKDRRIWLEV